MNEHNIAQFGTDGFGHQIFGIASCMALHGEILDDTKIYFDPHWSITKRPYSFEHITDENKLCEEYMKTAFNNFAVRNNFNHKTYNSVYPSTDEFHILGSRFPGKRNAPSGHGLLAKHTNNQILYLYDNAWRSVTPYIEKYRKKMILDWVENNDKLPKNRFTNKKTNIAIHMRLGDASKRKYNRYLKSNLEKVIDRCIKLYESPNIVIHTNGKVVVDDLHKANRLNVFSLRHDQLNYVEVCNEDTHVLNVLSDLIHADIMIKGDSALSGFASWIRIGKQNIASEKSTFLSDMLSLKEFIS